MNRGRVVTAQPLVSEFAGGRGMSDEINYYDEELVELIQKIEYGIDKLRHLRYPAKNEAIRELDERMKRAKQVLHSFKVEMRELSRDEAANYDERHKEHHVRLQALSGDLQMAKSDADRKNLGVRSIDELTPAQIIEVASKTQDDSMASVNRMKQKIAESKQVGADTASKLRQQTEQLKNIDTDIMKVKSNLNRADVLVRAFIRKMMTDKIILIFMCLIFMGVIAIIIYKIVKPDGGGGGSSTSNSNPSNPYTNQIYGATTTGRSLVGVQNDEPMMRMSALVEQLRRLLASVEVGSSS